MKKIPEKLIDILNRRVQRFNDEVKSKHPEVMIKFELELIKQGVEDIQNYLSDTPFELLIALNKLGVDDSILEDNPEELRELIKNELLRRYGKLAKFEFEGTGIVDMIHVYDITLEK